MFFRKMIFGSIFYLKFGNNFDYFRLDQSSFADILVKMKIN